MISLWWMAASSLLQQPASPVLAPGVELHGEIIAASEVLDDPALRQVRNGTFQPFRVQRYRVEVPVSGRFAVVVTAPLFRAITVVRDDRGRVLLEDLPDGGRRAEVELEAGRAYTIACGSTFGAEGPFSVRLLPATEPAPTPAEHLQRLEEVLARRQRELGADALQVAACLDAIGFHLFSRGDYRAAVGPMEQALAIWRQRRGDDSVMAAHGHWQVAAQLQRLGSYDVALAHFEQCARVRERIFGPEHERALIVRNRLAEVALECGRPEQVEPWLRQVLAARAGGDPEVAALQISARQNLAHLHHTLGRYSLARESIERALRDAEATFGPDSPSIGGILVRFATIEEALGRHAAAEVMRRRTLHIMRQHHGPDHVEAVTALNNLAVGLLERGRAEEAAERFRECLDIYRRRLGEHLYTAIALGNLGDCLARLKRVDEAEPLLLESLQLLERLGHGGKEWAAHVFSHLGAVATDKGEWDAAEERFARAITIWSAQRGALHPRTLGVRMKLGYMLRMAGRFDRAAEVFPAVLDDLLRIHAPDHPAVVTMAEGMAILHATMARWQDALAAAKDSVAGRWQHLGGELVAGSNEDRYRDAAGLQIGIDILLTIAQRHGGGPAVDAAFEWHAAAKGVVYRHVLWQRERLLHDLTPAQRELRGELEVCRASLARLAYAAAPTDVGGHAARIAELCERKNALEQRLGASLGAGFGDERVATAELAAALPADAALLDFRFQRPYRFATVEHGRIVTPEAADEERLWAFVLRGGAEHAELVDFGPAAPVRAAIADFVQHVTMRRGRDPGAADARPPAVVVRQLLWEPLAARLEGCTTLFVSADGEIGRVPFAALQRADGRYLVEQHTFVSVQDAVTLLRALRKPAPTRSQAPRLVALGAVDYDAGVAAEGEAVAGEGLAVDAGGRRGGYQDWWASLPATRSEVEALAAFHGAAFPSAERTLLVGAAATKAALAARAGSSEVLHLATHGFFEPAGLPSLWEHALEAAAGAVNAAPVAAPAPAAHPPGLLTGLALAGANQKQQRAAGVMTAEEVDALDLSGCELVVLSACETALGSVRGGEGMLSLRRAFHEAGARTVLSSLWTIGDESTAVLMRAFYRNLWERSLPPAQALRAAQLAMLELDRRRGGDGRPSTWAAFVLSGDWR